MPRWRTPLGATILVGLTLTIALALGAASCGDDDSREPSKTVPRNSAVGRCAGDECRVRIVCKGRVYVRRGPAPVRIHTSNTPFRTTIVADFAGPHDAVVRC